MNTVERVTASLIRGWQEGRRQSADGLSLDTAAQAYEVQQRVADRMGWFNGAPARSWKLGGKPDDGLISAARVPTDAVHPSGWQVPPGYCSGYGIEAEIFVRLSRDLNEHTDLDLAYDAVEAWMPGIELCDTRWLEGEKADPLLRLADQQLSRALIAGKPQLFRKSLNWNELKVSLLVNGVSHIFGKVGHPFIDPLSSLPWLARHAVAYSNPLRAGDLVATGSWTGLCWVSAGSRVEVAFDGLGEAVLFT